MVIVGARGWLQAVAVGWTFVGGLSLVIVGGRTRRGGDQRVWRGGR